MITILPYLLLAQISFPSLWEKTIHRDLASAYTVQNWKTEKFILPGEEDLTAIYFFDSLIGWIGGKRGSLYSTADGGKDWKQFNLGLSGKASIRSLFFTSLRNGYLVYQSLEGGGGVKMTSDGGRTWVESQVDSDATFKQVFFTDERHGILVGENQIRNSTPKVASRVWVTSDGGAKWVEVTDRIKESAKIDRGAIVDLCSFQSPEIALLFSTWDVLATSDSGNTWKKSTIPHDRPFNYEQLFRLRCIEQGQMLVVSNQESLMEGMGSTIRYVLADGKTTSTRTFSGLLFDAVVLSGGEIISCGSLEAEGTSIEKYIRDGIIAYSSDNGRTWSILFREAQDINKADYKYLVSHSKTLTSIAKINSNLLWVIGNHGVVIKVFR